MSNSLFLPKARKQSANPALDLWWRLEETIDRTRRMAGNKQRNLAYQRSWRLRLERVNRLYQYILIGRILVAKGKKNFSVDDIHSYWKNPLKEEIAEDLQLLGIYVRETYKKFPAGALMDQVDDIGHARGIYASKDNKHRKMSTAYNWWASKRSDLGKEYPPPKLPKS